MHGDLSITTQPAARDLAASAGGTRMPAARPSAPDGAGGHQRGPAPDASQQAAAAHLRTLLTDPAMRVSTHHDETSNRTVLKVHNRATGEVIEQIPAEALLRLYATMREPLVDERA